MKTKKTKKPKSTRVHRKLSYENAVSRLAFLIRFEDLYGCLDVYSIAEEPGTMLLADIYDKDTDEVARNVLAARTNFLKGGLCP